MKKEVIYSLRMSKAIRDALKAAAKKESRSIASLLNRIIKDYLEKNGFISDSSSIKEQRWFTRKEMFEPANIYLKAASEIQKKAIVILNISLGGVLIGYPKTSEIDLSVDEMPKFELCLELTNLSKPLCFDCEANRRVDSDHAVQVGAHFVNTNEADLQMLKTYLN